MIEKVTLFASFLVMALYISYVVYGNGGSHWITGVYPAAIISGIAAVLEMIFLIISFVYLIKRRRFLVGFMAMSIQIPAILIMLFFFAVCYLAM